MNNALSCPTPAMPVSKGAKPVADDDNRGKLSSIHAEPTDNGWNVRSSFKPAKLDPKIDSYAQQPEDEKMSFETHDKAMDHISKRMAEHDGYDAKPRGKKADKKEEKAADKAPKAEAEPDNA